MRHYKNGRYIFTNSDLERYSWRVKFHRVKVTFLNLAVTLNNLKHVETPPHHQLLAAAKQTNPNFLFISVKFPAIREYYLNYAAESTSKAILLFFDLYNPKVMSMPCIVCITSPTPILVNRISSLYDLAALWDATNTQNLHRSVMLTLIRFKKPDRICGFSLSGFDVNETSVDCTLHLLNQRYNFTYDTNIGVSLGGINQDSQKIVIGHMDFDNALTEEFISHIASEKLITYDVELTTIHFVIVTRGGIQL